MEEGGSWSKTSLEKSKRIYLKNKLNAKDLAQVVEYLPSKVPKFNPKGKKIKLRWQLLCVFHHN
jgi:hypothetical protein